MAKLNDSETREKNLEKNLKLYTTPWWRKRWVAFTIHGVLIGGMTLAIIIFMASGGSASK